MPGDLIRTFWSPSWRSLYLWKGHLLIQKKGTKNCSVTVFVFFLASFRFLFRKQHDDWGWLWLPSKQFLVKTKSYNPYSFGKNKTPFKTRKNPVIFWLFVGWLGSGCTHTPQLRYKGEGSRFGACRKSWQCLWRLGTFQRRKFFQRLGDIFSQEDW